jgi:signal transduction histidine kinase
MTRSAPTFKRFEALAFRRQQTAFGVITLFVIAVLLVMHTLFASLLGEPSLPVIVLLGVAFSLKTLEIIWLQGMRDGITERTAQIETAISGVGVFLLAILLANYTNRDDPPYFVLLAIPILQCAYHLGLFPTLLTIIAAIAMMFAWILHFFALHPPPRPTEYLETGMVAVIYSFMGPLVWYLVHQLKTKETKLYEQMMELESAREKLLAEEKLSAIGRFASGIAHEIRNPVAMISSSLATANQLSSEPDEREEMFAIAAREAKRLEKLTADFLSYARPVKPRLSQSSISDILQHISDVTRMRATDRDIEVTHEVISDASVTIDNSQIEGALLNLCLNAIDATPDKGQIEMRSRTSGDRLFVEIEDSGPRIRDEDLKRVFEPFFTTKPGGTGLGLAVARGVAIAHGGDLYVSKNEDGAVVFTMELMNDSAELNMEEAADGKSIDCRR